MAAVGRPCGAIPLGVAATAFASGARGGRKEGDLRAQTPSYLWVFPKVAMSGI